MSVHGERLPGRASTDGTVAASSYDRDFGRWAMDVDGATVNLTTDERLLGGRRGRVGRTQNEHVGWVIAKWNAFLFKGDDDAAAQFTEDRITLVSPDTDLNRIGDGTTIDLIDAEDDGISDGDVFERGVVTDTAGDGAKHGYDFIRIGTGIYTDVEGGEREIAR